MCDIDPLEVLELEAMSEGNILVVAFLRLLEYRQVEVMVVVL